MKINFQKLYRRIPTRARVAPRRFFNVLWADSMFDTKGNKIYGKTEFDTSNIILNKDQSERESVLTYWHEFIHALDHDHNIQLTEAQVLALEHTYPYIREFVLTLEGKKKKSFK